MGLDKLDLMDSSEIHILVERVRDEIFYNWLLFDKVKESSKGISIESCGGKGCQSVVASKLRSRQKFVISDRDFSFLMKKDYHLQIEEILKASREGKLIKNIDRKNFTVLKLFPTELENLFLLVTLEKDPNSLEGFIAEKKEKLIALTLLRCVSVLCQDTKEELKTYVKTCHEKETLELLINQSIIPLSQHQRNRLQFLRNKLNKLKTNEFLFVVAGKEFCELLETAHENPVGKVLKELGFNLKSPEFPSSSGEAYRKGSSRVLDNLRAELTEILRRF